MEKNQYHLMDVIDGLKTIQTNSVDIIIIDPPYNIGKDFGENKDNLSIEDYVLWSKGWITESVRILKETGSLYIYGFSEILSYISVNLPINKRWLIWHYTNKATPGYVSGFQRSHESIIWGYKSNPIFNVDSVRIPYTERFLKNSSGKSRTVSNTARYGGKETVYTAHHLGALPRDVFTDIPALAGGSGSKERYFLLDDKFYLPKQMKELNPDEKKRVIKHPTQKPFELTKRLILSSKPENGLVVIPFGGSGSEGVVCKKFGLDFIGFDINPIFIKLSNQAVEHSDELFYPA